jgi:glycerophosphoryl diester phosphodiesterase
MYELLASKSGRVHVCGHRGHSIDQPENTMAAFCRAVELGGTSLEIDVVMSGDGDIVVLHDLMVDRTTDGRGFAEDIAAAEICALDAGSQFDKNFAGESVPLLSDILVFARDERIGLHCEIKDPGNEDALIARLAGLLEDTGSIDWFVAISFDHQQLAKAKIAIPGLRTEGITHARHVDPGGFVARAGVDSVSVEAGRFRAEDGRAIHATGVAIRCHLPVPDKIAKLEKYGRDLRSVVGNWVSEGVVDIISGDDVGYLRMLVDEYRPS